MLMYAIPTIILFLTALLFLIFKRNEKQQEQKHSGKLPLPPGNACLPFIGESLAFMKPRPLTKLGGFMDNRISRYGKIFSTNLFGKHSIVSADPELNRFAFNNEGKLFRPGFPRPLEKLHGVYAPILVQGEVHKHMRSTILAFVNNKRMRELILQDADKIASQMISSWKEGRVILATEEAVKFSFYIMVKKILSMTQEDPEVKKLMSEYKTWSNEFDSTYLFRHFPGSSYRKALKSRDYIIQKIIKEMEDKAMKHFANTEMAKDDFLGWVMKNTDYSQEQICDLLLGVLFAGHDTTAKSISLLIYFLERCPKAVKQLREEHLQIVRSNKQHGDEGKLTVDDIKSMEFTRCVIDEMLRLGNIVTFLPRTATKDVQFKSYTIPQGYTIQLHLAAVQLDPSIYEDPECFNPWRWMSSSTSNLKNIFMPFGGGLRLCPGAELARLEISVFLHHLVLKHEWESVEPDHHPMAKRTVEFSNGLPIKVRAISAQVS